MNSTGERYELCFQCISESGFIALTKELKDKIRKLIMENGEWRNPFWFHTLYSMNHYLCDSCPYMTEHVLLAQEDIREYRFL